MTTTFISCAAMCLFAAHKSKCWFCATNSEFSLNTRHLQKACEKASSETTRRLQGFSNCALWRNVLGITVNRPTGRL